MNTFEKIYAVVKRIPRGRVATYGTVALLAGNPRWARVVGYALHANRVVNRFGETTPAFAFGGEGRHRALLEQDGIRFLPDGRVDLSAHEWFGE